MYGGATSPGVYMLCLCRGVAHALLEKVDRYLWSPRPSALGPHVYSSLTVERDTDTHKVLSI